MKFVASREEHKLPRNDQPRGALKIYENAASCEVQAIDADSFVTPEKAAATLNPMLEGPEPEWMK